MTDEPQAADGPVPTGEPQPAGEPTPTGEPTPADDPGPAADPQPDDEPAPGEDAAPPPSKSARKRAAQQAQQLGEALIALRDRDLAALDLPERLLEAVREARAIRSRGAAARQRQYIGRLMREIDVEAVRAALARRR